MTGGKFPEFSELTFRAEGGYLPATLRAHYPGGGASGVTLGPGYDMGSRAQATVEADLLAAGVEPATARALSQAAGKKGTLAKDWIKEDEHAALTITMDASRALFLLVYPEYVRRARRATAAWGGHWDSYPPEMQEVLVDLAYRGDLSKKHRNHLRGSMIAANYQEFRERIADVDYWQRNCNLPKQKDGSPHSRFRARANHLPPKPPAARETEQERQHEPKPRGPEKRAVAQGEGARGPQTTFANGRGIAHKGSGGTSMIFPDVCLTPVGPSVVPIPYPNIGVSADTSKGPKTVTTDHQMPMVKGAEYAKSSGDEAGVNKGVMSGTNMAPCEFMSYSFDVKFEGRNACRLGDTLFHNRRNGVG